MNKIEQWLIDHPAIKLSEIARTMGIKRNFLVEKLHENAGRKFDPAFCMQLVQVLIPYGFKIKGQVFYKFDDTPKQVFSYSFKDKLDDEGVESVDKGDHYEYNHILYKGVFDEFNLWNFITLK